eukprot:CAMPEP_0119570880 /NCGR_PEP_ID=MMETSP1352-20130426/43840_1 /TAXON_ID=265584 /ORGANISM="Stauroneis constricta, Strain CCMP1120" /LENGTH=790 /DNA_ID=CAMNT_0007620557 /DNA_START=15 /DNA_END=2383 /DNA_ORIENTATION=-
MKALSSAAAAAASSKTCRQRGQAAQFKMSTATIAVVAGSNLAFQAGGRPPDEDRRLVVDATFLQKKRKDVRSIATTSCFPSLSTCHGTKWSVRGPMRHDHSSLPSSNWPTASSGNDAMLKRNENRCRHDRKLHTGRASSRTATIATVTTPPSAEPLLLLEGDSYHISKDGAASSKTCRQRGQAAQFKMSTATIAVVAGNNLAFQAGGRRQDDDRRLVVDATLLQKKRNGARSIATASCFPSLATCHGTKWSVREPMRHDHSSLPSSNWSTASSGNDVMMKRNENRRQHDRTLHTDHASSRTATTATATTPPGAEPMLLLEGDSYHISKDGIATTVYQLCGDKEDASSIMDAGSSSLGSTPASFGAGSAPKQSYCLEEIFDLEHSRKRYRLHGGSVDHVLSGIACSNGNMIDMGGNSIMDGFDNQQEDDTFRFNASSLAAAPGNASVRSSVDLQEVSGGSFSSSIDDNAASMSGSTGCMTWEASLAMSLYFAARPHLLQSQEHGSAEQEHRIIELGSGVGLGGLFVHDIIAMNRMLGREDESAYLHTNKFDGAATAATTSTNTPAPPPSLVLTDCNEVVLQQCRDNVRQHRQKRGFRDQQSDSGTIQVANLDWFNLIGGDNDDGLSGAEYHADELQTRIPPTTTTVPERKEHRHKYDVVLACDCAYRPQDVPVLMEASLALLKKKRGNGNGNGGGGGLHSSSSSSTPISVNSKPTIHMFGPSNRQCFIEMHRQWKRNPEVRVVAEELTLERHRLRLDGDKIATSSSAMTTAGSYTTTTRTTASILHLMVQR